MTPSFPRTALYGLGIIGSRVAANLAQAGFPLATWNRTPKPDAPGWVSDPAAAAVGAGFHQIFVKDAAAVHSVLDAILPVLEPGAVVAIHATIHPDEMKLAAERISRAGGEPIDAPFTGSREAAAAANLVYYLAGEPATIERARPWLAVSSRDQTVFEGIGTASAIKIATNTITASIVQALAEALAVTRAAGVPATELQRAVEGNACRSGTSDLKLATMIVGDFTPHFSLENMLKDVRFALDLASQSGATLPALSRTAAVMEQLASEPQTAALDFSALAKQFG